MDWWVANNKACSFVARGAKPAHLGATSNSSDPLSMIPRHRVGGNLVPRAFSGLAEKALGTRLGWRLATHTHSHASVSWLQLLSQVVRFAEFAGKRQAVEVLATGTSDSAIRPKYQEQSHVKQDQNCYGDKNLNDLPPPVPRAECDVRKEDEGEQKPEQEAAHVSEVVDVGKQAE